MQVILTAGFNLIGYNRRMPPFYTATGDDGTTGILGDKRLSKAHPRIELLGTLDEASAALGLARAQCSDQEAASLVLEIQRDLYRIMAEVAATSENQAHFQFAGSERLVWLEACIEQLSSSITIPAGFTVPGDNLPSAAFSLARTIVRRAERRMADLQEKGELTDPILLKYLNRLSSLCYVLEIQQRNASGGKTTFARGNLST